MKRLSFLMLFVSSLSFAQVIFYHQGQTSSIVNPLTVADLKFYVEADSGVYTDTAGTTPATTNGAAIKRANDRSGNNNYAKEQTANPTLSVVGGVYAFNFSNSKLVTTGFLSSSFNTAFTYMVVAHNPGDVFLLNASHDNATFYSGDAYLSQVVPYFANLSNPSVRNVLNDSTFVQTISYNGSNVVITINSDSVYEGSTGNIGASGTLTLGDLSGGGYAWSGKIYAFGVWQRALSKTEINGVENYFYDKFPVFNRRTRIQIIVDGNSMSNEISGFAPNTNAGKKYIEEFLRDDYPNTYRVKNVSILGQTTKQMIVAAPTRVDPFYDATRLDNVLFAWEGTNHIYLDSVSAQTAYDSLVSYCQQRRDVGWKVIIGTILPRSSVGTPSFQEARRDSVNVLIRANWATFADEMFDVAANTDIGEAGDSDNVTYYVDKVHMTATGYQIVADSARVAFHRLP